MRITVVTALTALLVVHFAHAQPGLPAVEIKSGFITGQVFLDMEATNRARYAAGIIDGILLAPLLGAPKERLVRLEQCVTAMSDRQVAAMLDAQLRSEPETWHQSAHTAMYRALISRCPK